MPQRNPRPRLGANFALVVLCVALASPVLAAPSALPPAGWLTPLVRTLAAWLTTPQAPGGPFDQLGCAVEPHGEPLCEPAEPPGARLPQGDGPFDQLGCAMEPSGDPLCAPTELNARLPQGGGPLDQIGCAAEPSGEPLCAPAD